MKTNRQVTIGLVGDVMLARSFNQTLKPRLKSQNNQEDRLKYPWGDMLSELQSVDLLAINLETTITDATRKKVKAFNYKLNPKYREVSNSWKELRGPSLELTMPI